MDKPCMNVSLMLILVVTFSLVIVILLSPDSKDIYSRLESDAGLLAVIITIAIFLIERVIDNYKTTKEKIERNNNSCNAVLKEISGINNRFAINNEDKNDSVTFNRYINNLWDTSAYDSIVNSGLFTNFKADTQTYLSNLYSKIKSRNNLLIYLDKFVDISVSYPYYPDKENIIDNRERFYHTELITLEADIGRLLDVVKDLMNKELL